MTAAPSSLACGTKACAVLSDRLTLEELTRRVAPTLVRVHGRLLWIARGGRGRLPRIAGLAEAARQQILNGPGNRSGKKYRPSSLVRGIAAAARDNYPGEALQRLLDKTQTRIEAHVRKALTLPGRVVFGRTDNGPEVALPRVALLHGLIDRQNDCIQLGRSRWFYIEVAFADGTQPVAVQAPSSKDVDVDVTAHDDHQMRFDAEKRRRIAAGEKHSFDPMTVWARHTLGVDTNRSAELWGNRSAEFRRTGGALKRSIVR